MADLICRWRNGTPKTVVELVNSLPHTKMTNEDFRLYMQDSQWGNEFFRTPYQLACQLGLYCEAEDGYYYPRFDHDISENEAQEYLEFWMPRYYVPNPYVGRNGFNDIKCPTYVLYELYMFAKHHPNCTYKEAYKTVFQEEPTNNNDIVKNYINNYSKVLFFDSNGYLNVTEENPLTAFSFMDRNSKKEFFDNFSNSNSTIIRNDLPLQQIFYGAPGTGKSHEIKEKIKGEAVVRTTFHPDSDYSTFVGAYKPTMDDVEAKVVPVVLGESGTVFNKNEGTYKEKCIVYQFVMQAFLKAYLGAWKKYAEANGNEVKPQFLIIEEINRGNCAQIFGDLFQLLDRNENGFSEYPIEADTDLQQEIERAFKEHRDYKLKEGVKINAEGVVGNYTSNYGTTLSEDIQCGRVLLLPSNLYIWATMNTSDQSLFPIDSAFKRRWDWQYIPISNANKGWIIKVNGKKYDWWDFLEKMNEQINTTTNSEDKKMGYFFCMAKDGIIDAKTFVGKVVFYVWNDVFKDFANEADCLFKDEDGTLLSFNKFYRVVNGKTEVLEGKVEQFMTNLGLEPMEEGIE